MNDIKIFDYFRDDEAIRAEKHFGKDFMIKLASDIEMYTKKWQLSRLRFIPSYSINCVFTCYSEQYGDVVLKIGKPSKETYTEYYALREYNGDRFCQVYEADLDNGVLLEERIMPGTTLWEGGSLDKRLSVLRELFDGLHIESKDPHKYPTYQRWVKRITAYMSGRDDATELYLHMKRAEQLFAEVSVKYNRSMLLHGDIHPDNILLSEECKYKLIDPKGVIGDPVLDLGQFIINEYEDTITDDLVLKINYIIEYLARELGIPDKIIRTCLYIQTAMSECWHVEDGSPPSLDKVELAQSIMQM